LTDGERAKVAYEARLLQAQAQSIEQQLLTLEGRMVEINAAVETLHSLGKQDSVMVPAGAGVMLRAKLTDSDRVLADVGAGIAMEKSVKEALELLQKRSDSMQKGIKQLREALEVVGGRMAELQERAAKA